jgi:hypothetical protein
MGEKRGIQNRVDGEIEQKVTKGTKGFVHCLTLLLLVVKRLRRAGRRSKIRACV